MVALLIRGKTREKRGTKRTRDSRSVFGKKGSRMVDGNGDESVRRKSVESDTQRRAVSHQSVSFTRPLALETWDRPERMTGCSLQCERESS
jgi:hypothetical protein